MFVHLVWATWRRTPLISEAIEKWLYGAIRTRCLKLGCPVVAVGGTADHVHLLVELHPSTRRSTGRGGERVLFVCDDP